MSHNYISPLSNSATDLEDLSYSVTTTVSIESPEQSKEIFDTILDEIDHSIDRTPVSPTSTIYIADQDFTLTIELNELIEDGSPAKTASLKELYSDRIRIKVETESSSNAPSEVLATCWEITSNAISDLEDVWDGQGTVSLTVRYTSDLSDKKSVIRKTTEAGDRIEIFNNNLRIRNVDPDHIFKAIRRLESENQILNQ